MTPALRRLPQLLSAPAIARSATPSRATAQSAILIRAQRLSTSRPTESSFRPTSEGGEISEIIFAVGQPKHVPNRLSKLSAWSITSSRTGITRHFTFPTFNAAWRFMSKVADECKAKRHHPSWSNLYNEVSVEWTTHKPLGLSIKDIEMAEFCDRTADEVGLKEQKAQAVNQGDK